MTSFESFKLIKFNIFHLVWYYLIFFAENDNDKIQQFHIKVLLHCFNFLYLHCMENNIWNKSLKQLYGLGVFAYWHDYKMCITFDLVGGILRGFHHFVSLINVF